MELVRLSCQTSPDCLFCSPVCRLPPIAARCGLGRAGLAQISHTHHRAACGETTSIALSHARAWSLRIGMEFVATAYFWTFYITTFYVLLSVLLAVVLDSYSDVKARWTVSLPGDSSPNMTRPHIKPSHASGAHGMAFTVQLTPCPDAVGSLERAPIRVAPRARPDEARGSVAPPDGALARYVRHTDAQSLYV